MTVISNPIPANAGQVQSALRQASDETGVDFDYLLRTAMRESSLENTAKATTSSAAGLFQFIEQTWLGVVKRNGAEFGMGTYADAISVDGNGRHFVSDPAMKSAILAERYDPESSALMAGALTREASDRMQTELGRDVSGGELYLAHFLGTGGAIDFIQATEIAPGRKAADLFPQAARANRSIFYREDGAPRTNAEVYRTLISKHTGTGADYPALPGDQIERPAPRYTPGAPQPQQRMAGGYGGSAMVLNASVIELLASLDVPGVERGSSNHRTRA